MKPDTSARAGEGEQIMNTEQLRDEFEAWANGRCELHLVNPSGRYSSAITQFAWEAYQAGRAALGAQPADDEVVFIDGVGAGRSSIKSCHNGVQWIMVGDRVYWPLSDSDAKRLQSACCGNGSFDGPASPAGEGERMKFVLSGPIKGVRKSYALWVESGVQFQPLVYFQKPKWIKDDAALEKFICGAFTMISAEGQAALNEMLESAVSDREGRND